MPTLSIIIPAFNEEKLLGQSLQAIQASRPEFTDAGFITELIVCDNNSTDRTATIARAAGAKVVFEPINQIGRARNTGAAAATGEWLLFIDADSYPSATLFRATARALLDPACLAGGARVTPEGGVGLAIVFVWIWNTLSRCKRWAAGSYIFCRTAPFRDLGGFSPKLYASEEIELFMRLKALAKARGQRISILSTPLLTSARKLKLYSLREYSAFMLRAVFRPLSTLRNREKCAIWYDGRR